MTSLFDSIQSPGRKTVLATLVAGLGFGFSVPALAEPGSVVISAVYGGGGNANAPFSRDYIELFNRSASTINLRGMSVQYQAAANTNWSGVTALPAIDLAPGQYFLVAEASGGSVGADVGHGRQGCAGKRCQRPAGRDGFPIGQHHGPDRLRHQRNRL
jgi:hypothetical protein